MKQVHSDWSEPGGEQQKYQRYLNSFRYLGLQHQQYFSVPSQVKVDRLDITDQRQSVAILKHYAIDTTQVCFSSLQYLTTNGIEGHQSSSCICILYKSHVEN